MLIVADFKKLRFCLFSISSSMAGNFLIKEIKLKVDGTNAGFTPERSVYVIPIEMHSRAPPCNIWRIKSVKIKKINTALNK